MLESGRGKGSIGVEKSGELGNYIVALDVVLASCSMLSFDLEAVPTFSSTSSSFASVFRSSSDGFGGILTAVENCE